jgi:hypothetical protein
METGGLQGLKPLPCCFVFMSPLKGRPTVFLLLRLAATKKQTADSSLRRAPARMRREEKTEASSLGMTRCCPGKEINARGAGGAGGSETCPYCVGVGEWRREAEWALDVEASESVGSGYSSETK